IEITDRKGFSHKLPHRSGTRKNHAFCAPPELAEGPNSAESGAAEFRPIILVEPEPHVVNRTRPQSTFWYGRQGHQRRAGNDLSGGVGYGELTNRLAGCQWRDQGLLGELRGCRQAGGLTATDGHDDVVR